MKSSSPRPLRNLRASAVKGFSGPRISSTAGQTKLSPMDSAQIATLLAPFLSHPMNPAQLTQISTYIDLLLRWNARTNLTAIRTPEDIVTRHFGESLFAAQVLFPSARGAQSSAPAPQASHIKAFVPAIEPTQIRDTSTPAPQYPGPGGTFDNSPALQRRDPPTQEKRPVGTPETPPQLIANAKHLDLLDLGSGPGFPGLPIHLVTPHLHTTLLESQQKKVAFLREVIRALTLTNINVSPARAEDFPNTASTVTLRAVERFDHILPTAARLVAPAGRLALLIAGPQLSRAQAALPNLTWQPPIAVPNSTARILLVGSLNSM
jgi:16S rRNA (guanine(527)-N(7))-methyltransferase RsmG